MKIEEYQQKTKLTAAYPKEKGIEYCLLGVTGEVGEVCNKYKKVIRDNNSIISPEIRQKLTDELGDVLWYISQLSNEHSYTLYIDDSYTKDEYPLLQLEVEAAWCCYDFIETGRVSESYIQDVLNELVKVCRWLEADIEIIMDNNITKLLSRKERGVIQGSGDNR